MLKYKCRPFAVVSVHQVFGKFGELCSFTSCVIRSEGIAPVAKVLTSVVLGVGDEDKGVDVGVGEHLGDGGGKGEEVRRKKLKMSNKTHTYTHTHKQPKSQTQKARWKGMSVQGTNGK